MATPEMINGLINEFNTEIYTQIQQRISKLRGFIDVVMIEKEKRELDNIGGVDFTQNDSSFVKVDSVATDITYAKRLLKSNAYYMAHKVDSTLANMLGPKSSTYNEKVIEQIVNKYQYYIDKICYTALDADAEAKDGTAITFAADNGQSVDLKALADFTAAKVLNAKQLLTAQGFGVYENSGIGWILSDMERTILEKDTSVSNVDYKVSYGIKQDEDGNLTAFKGINLFTLASSGQGDQKTIFTTTGATLGTHSRKTFMFNTNKNNNGQSALTLGIRKESIVDMYDPKDYFNTTIIKGQFNIGATRNANSGIVKVLTPVATA